MDFQEARRRRDASTLAPRAARSEAADRRASDAKLRRAIRDVFARERAGLTGRDERAGDPLPSLKLVRDAPR